MTIRVNIDGRPYQILFSGTIDIGRMSDGEAVAIRLASEDAKLWGVGVDHKELDRKREFMREMRIRTESWNRWWEQQITADTPYRAIAREFHENLGKIVRENTHGDLQ